MQNGFDESPVRGLGETFSNPPVGMNPRNALDAGFAKQS